MRLEDISITLGYTFAGDGNTDVKGINYFELATSEEIAIVHSAKEIEQTQASVLLMEPNFIETDKNIIFCDTQVELAAKKIALLFISKGLYVDYSRPVAYKMNDSMVRIGRDFHQGKNTYIEGFTSIGDRVSIGDNCYIGTNVTIGSDVTIGDNVIIRDGCRIGSDAFFQIEKGNKERFVGVGKVIIEDGVEIGCNSLVQRGTFGNTIIGRNTVFGDFAGIGHDVQVGSNCLIMGKTGLAGRSIVEDNVKIYGQCGIRGNVRIGKNSVIMSRTGVWKDVEENSIISGSCGRKHSDELRIQAKLRSLMRR